MTDKIHVEGRRWFDRVNGNTYHGAKVYADDILIGVAPFQYGYDSQYEESAYDVLDATSVLAHESYSNGVPLTLRRACVAHGITLTTSHVDVTRRRDLATWLTS